MKIERSKFLLFAGAISAATGVAVTSASCTTTSSSPTTPVNDSGLVTPPPGGGETDADQSDAADASVCLGDSVSNADAGDGGDGGDGGSDCSALVTNGCDGTCDTVMTTFRAGIAADIKSCLLGLPSCEGSDAVTACVATSGAKACDDPSAVTACAPLVSACTPDGGVDAGDGGATVFDKSTCEAVMKTLSTEGRDTFISCVTEGVPGNCTADPGFCVDQARFRQVF